MATVRITEEDLRSAMRDPRYWQFGHPERAAFNAWVTDGWRALVDAREGGGSAAVHVRAYQRVRNGRPEHVSDYIQTRHRRGHQEPPRGGRMAPDSEARTNTEAAPSVRPVVVFVGGAGDRSIGQIVRRSWLAFRRDHPAYETQYFTHDEGDELRRFVEAVPPGTPVNILGHSWGADTAAQVVAALGTTGRTVDRLVTIDPVGRGTGRSFFSRVRAGARHWVNVNATGGSFFHLPNMIAGLGRKYGDGPREYAHTYIDTPHSHEAFEEMLNIPGQGGRRVLDLVLDR